MLEGMLQFALVVLEWQESLWDNQRPLSLLVVAALVLIQTLAIG